MTRATGNYQEDVLRKRATGSGVFSNLIFFYAVQKAFDQLDSLALQVSRDEERLQLAMLRGEDPRPLTEAVPPQADPWFYYSLAKALLRQNLLQEALGLVEQSLESRRPDTCAINLVLKQAVNLGLASTARQLIEISLQLAPQQDDLRVLYDRLGTGEAVRFNLYLSPLPQCFRVAFYIPAYQSESFIGQALEAVLGQCYPLEEILLVDDGSTDATAAIAREYPVYVVCHGENRGLAAARNTAFNHLQASYVGAADSDVCLDAGYTKYIMMEFENTSPEVAGIGGRLEERYTGTPADRWRWRHLSQDPGPARIHPPRFLYGSNTVYRREPVLEAGGYNDKYRTNSEDGDIARKLLASGYSFSYTPHARAEHLRRDTPASVLRTFWNWAADTRSRLAVFDTLDTLFAEIERIPRRIADLIRLDQNDGLHDILYVDFLCLFHETFLDLHYAVEQKMLSANEAGCVHTQLLDSIKALDARYQGRLYDKVLCDSSALLIPEQDREAQPTPWLENKLGRIIGEVNNMHNGISKDLYRKLMG